MANYQNITPVKLGQAAITTSYATLYTTPLLTKTYLKQFDIANTNSTSIGLYVHLVPVGGTATTANAIAYNIPLAVASILQWTGVEIMEPGSMIQVKASATGCTITASGGEAV